MIPILTVFERSPDGGWGLARDMRVRWALEEAGRTYEVRPLSFSALKDPDHLSRHPFGQIPTFEDGDLVVFESGAIVLTIAEDCPALLPPGRNGRVRAIAWLFAALNTVEPPIVEREMALIFDRDEDGFAARLRTLDEAVERRLGALSAYLGQQDWLDESFSAGDLMMATVLLRLKGSALLARHANLAAYLARGESRPAYQRAFAAQHATFTAGTKA